MSLKEHGIEHKKIDNQLIAYIQCTIKNKDKLQPIVKKLIHQCNEYIYGPAFSIHYWLTGDEKDIEVCVPIIEPIETGEIKSRTLEGVDVLSYVHTDPMNKEKLNEKIMKISLYAREHGLPIAERRREIFLDSNNPEGKEIEYQVVIHNWTNLLVTNIERVLGEKISQGVLQDLDVPKLESSNNERFRWVKTVLERLEGIADSDQIYDIISRCAHIFPKEHIQRLRDIYEKTRNDTNDPLAAIDEVLRIMRENKLWFPEPYRKGNVIYSEKNPANPKAYEEATNDAERRKAYCFCPVIKNYLEEGIIPNSFCNCSAGWERQQWEGIFNKPVKVDVVKSLVKGDATCKFAIHIPNGL
ncbi:MAG: hypothetical protein ACFFDT_10690 [Candidatus Hodarchaeota archaeon]